MSDFKKMVAVVTGAASGIGYATAMMFMDQGYEVCALDRHWSDSARESMGRSMILTTDVSNEDDVEKAFSLVIERFSRIDILVNAAGMISRKTILETTASDWDAVLQANLRSVFLVSRAALISMVERKSGAIVNVSSGWGLVGGKRAAAYCAAKGGVVLLTKAMAVDHGVDGIRINCICPGDTDTPMLKGEASQLGLPVSAMLNAAASRPLGRVGKPEEIANVIDFLAGSRASFITGTVLVVDGGSLAGSS